MKYYVIINGESSLDIEGLAIESLPAISKPLMRSKREEIDGRNGDIITQLGFSAYDKTLKIGLWGNYDIDEIISYFNQDGIITFSNEPDMYYNFTILNRIDFINQLEAFRKATITIHCQPFKYKEEETETLELVEHQEDGTSLNLEDTIEAPMQIDLKGNTSQVQLSGKNLYIPIVWTKAHNQVSYTFYNDGSILVNGTANGASFSMYTSEATSYMQYLDAGTYTLSGGSNKVQLKILDESGNAIANTTSGSTTATFTLNSRIKIWLRCEVANTIQVNNEIITPMIEVGSTATTYEAYCGGVPSPNPSYPQDIHNVSGNNSVVVCGKNLFDKNDITTGLYYYASGTSESGNWAIAQVRVQPNTNYYLSGNNYNNATAKIVLLNSSKNIISDVGGYKNVHLITTNSNTAYIGLSIANYEGSSDLSSIQLEKGSTATTYEAYNGTTYPINLGDIELNKIGTYEDKIFKTTGKNLIDITNMLVHGGWTDTTFVPTSTNYITLQYIKVDPSTQYTLSTNLSSSKYSTIRIVDFDSSKNIIRRNAGINLSTSNTFTTSVDAYYIAICFFTSQTSSTSDLTQAQLELGNQATPYEPYGSGEWYKKANIGKVVLNGSEDWRKSTASTSDWLRCYYTSTLPYGKDLDLSLCNNFTYGNVAQVNDNCFQPYNNVYYGINIKISTSIGTTADALKTWLGTHNTIVYSALETSTYTKITDTTLLSQLEAIYNAKSKNGTTNINQENNDLPFILDIDYFTGTNEITITNNGNTYSKPLLTLVGSGVIGIYLNDNQIFQVALGTNETIIIDTDKMEAYYESTLKNRQVIGDYNSFKLLSGDNTIRISGTFSKLQVDNYSRWI